MVSASSERIRATPYARRLARERNLPLAVIAGSGPNGRITGDDLRNYRPREATAPGSVAQAAGAPASTIISTVHASPVPAAEQRAGAVAAEATPSAVVARVEFTALEALLTQIAAVRPGVMREDICLKAAAVALQDARSSIVGDGILLLAPPDRRHRLPSLADVSVSAIAAMRESSAAPGKTDLAVSFLGRAGVRPVAAQLVDGVSARLVVGAAQKDGTADCLLSYDPAKVGDDAAEDFLAAFRDLVEAPFRLLV